MAAVLAFPRSHGKGRQPASVERIRDLEMEIHAAGSEMVAMSNRITNALTAGDSHSAMHFASRLGCLGQSYLGPEPRDVA